MQAFPAAHINNVGIGRRDGNRANRPRRLAIEKRLPSASEVRGLPDAAIHRSDVEDVWLAGNSRQGTCAAAAKWPDIAPAHLGELRGVDLLGCELGGETGKQKKGEERSNSSLH